MKKYTIISFCFGDYDILREPLIVDDEADYIFITDTDISSIHWKVVVDHDLVGTSPVYASYYVRHHPFKYASTDIVIVIDASIQLNDSLHDIVTYFDAEKAEYSILSTIYKSDEHKLLSWRKEMQTTPTRISEEDLDTLQMFIKRMGQENWRGSIGQAFIIYRNTPAVRRFSKHTWRYLMALGHGGNPIRIDEIVIHKLLARYADILHLFIISMQVIQSSYMTYCKHSCHTPNIKHNNYDQYFYLCNKPVSPIRFDKAVNFPAVYKFKTEAILLTKYMCRPDDLREWLNHHLYRAGFEHIHVFDNESGYDVKAVCDEFGEKVSYQKVYGQARQYRLYDAYINNISSAEWVMPIDDDEYLDIGDFSTVYDAISYYKHKLPHMMIFGVRWKHLFPEKFHAERTGGVLTYCTKENPELAKSFMHLGDATVKCIVRRYGNIHYEETWENPAGGHVPKHTCSYGAVMCDGRGVLGCGIPNCPDNLEDERIRLLHCRYKGMDDYKNRMSYEYTVSDIVPRKKKWEFDTLLPYLD